MAFGVGSSLLGCRAWGLVGKILCGDLPLGLILFSRSSMGACGLEFGVQGAGLAGLWASSQSLGLMCSRRCMGACELEFGLQGAGLEGLRASSQGV